MAQRVSITLVDDIDGSDADQTIQFGLDGTSYEIDLSDENAAKLREALAPYVGMARSTGGRRPRGAPKAARSGGSSAGDIRAWAIENGHQVNARGRISAELRAAYEAATGRL